MWAIMNLTATWRDVDIQTEKDDGGFGSENSLHKLICPQTDYVVQSGTTHLYLKTMLEHHISVDRYLIINQAAWFLCVYIYVFCTTGKNLKWTDTKKKKRDVRVV